MLKTLTDWLFVAAAMAFLGFVVVRLDRIGGPAYDPRSMLAGVLFTVLALFLGLAVGQIRAWLFRRR
ncbi:MAG: hypothetical protein C0501_21280 [Isosphaera sp.]|nr:hypothetical protein [Isosphaera sp.]